MEELHRFIEGKADFTGNVQTSIMALDVLFHHFPAMSHPVIGRSFFMRDGAVPLGGGVEMWRGIFQSVRPGSGKLFLNVDVAASAFVRPLPLPDYVADVLGRATQDLQRHPLNDQDRRKVERMLKMVQIETTHRPERRKYRILTVSTDPASRLQFTQSDGTKITVVEYFKTTYGKALFYPNLPCVGVGDVKKGIFLPMEICKIVEGQRYSKKLDEKQTAAMIRQTASKPRDRLNATLACVDRLKFGENSYLDAFGVKVNSSMSQADARRLTSPKLVCNQTSRGGNTAIVDNGSWDLRDRRYVSLAKLNNWAVIPFCGPRDVDFDTVKRFITELTEQCKKSGVNVANPNPFVEKPVGRTCDISRVIDSVIQQVQNKMKAPPQLIIAIVAFANPIYHDIKKYLELAGGPGIPSQVLLLKHVKAAQAQYCASVSLQINTKLGGLNWNLSRNDLPFLSAAPTIIFGADVTHPSPGENEKPSIAAVVASMSQDGTRYSTQLRKQASRTEIIEDLDEMVIALLKRFYTATKCQPRQILFYRDGVSEGQFRAVQESEINAIRKACHRLNPGYNPKITFVVVQKRHHTRFYGINQQDTDRSGNLKSGLVVDSIVTHPTQFCFYLQSHRGIVGTCRPAYYHVLCDENNFTADSLQRLTFNLCHILQRATKTVSYCTPGKCLIFLR
ncbi:Piwi domain-containing protein [Paraphysoderma sedebokerense]|nr:Piwi domain-containing protein [Paraphysoderma sedebokerense]